MMKFKVGDKVVAIDKILKEAGLYDLKIRKGIVTKVMRSPFIEIQRGKEKSRWHTDFWRKEK